MAREHDESLKPASWAQRLLAEAFGTFALTLVAGGADVFAQSGGHHVDHVARYIAPGLLIMAMIYSLGECSGAHLNPAITFGFALRSDIHWHDVPRYTAAQLVGALGASLALYAIVGPDVALAVTHVGSGFAPWQACATEAILTTLLAFVVFGTAAQAKIVGPNAALAVGGTVALCGLFASPISGASMNPARTLGPMIVSGDFASIWVYLVGPYLGAALATAIAFLIHGAPGHDEKKAGRGERHA